MKFSLSIILFQYSVGISWLPLEQKKKSYLISSARLLKILQNIAYTTK